MGPEQVPELLLVLIDHLDDPAWANPGTKRSEGYTSTCTWQGRITTWLSSLGWSEVGPFDVEDAVGLLVHHVDQHVRLGEVHRAVLVHVELRKEESNSVMWDCLQMLLCISSKQDGNSLVWGILATIENLLVLFTRVY